MSVKIKSVEEFNDDINSLINKRNNLILEAEKLNKDLFDLIEKRNEIDLSKFKAICINCNGKGYKETEDGKKTMCPLCNMSGFMWVDKYIGDNKDTHV